MPYHVIILAAWAAIDLAIITGVAAWFVGFRSHPASKGPPLAVTTTIKEAGQDRRP
jgi:hypothetical protein